MRKVTLYFALLFFATAGTASAISLSPAPGLGPYLFTETFGPNGAGYPEGWFLSVGTFIDTVPQNIASITASQAGESNFFNLSHFYTLPGIPFWGVENIRQPYSLSGPTGQWTITGTDVFGNTASASTHTLDRPAQVPTTTVWFEKYYVDDWFVWWDLAPFQTYSPGIDQIEVRIIRLNNDTVYRALLTPADYAVQIPSSIVALNKPLWVRIIARDRDLSELGGPLENRSSSFGFFNPNAGPGFVSLECDGFESPMDKDSVKVSPPRVLPFKARLFDPYGNPVTAADLAVPPEIHVRFIPGQPGAPENVTGNAVPVGAGTDAGQFVFTTDGNWQYNLSTGNYSQAGTYIVSIRSGDHNEYVINPSCLGTFVTE